MSDNLKVRVGGIWLEVVRTNAVAHVHIIREPGGRLSAILPEEVEGWTPREYDPAHQNQLACPDCGRIGSVRNDAKSFTCDGCGRVWVEEDLEGWAQIIWPEPARVHKDGGGFWGGRFKPASLREDGQDLRRLYDAFSRALYRALHIHPDQVGRTEQVRAELELGGETVSLVANVSKDGDITVIGLDAQVP